MAATPYGEVTAQSGSASSLQLTVDTANPGDLLVVYLSCLTSSTPSASTPGLNWLTRRDQQDSVHGGRLISFYAVAGLAGPYVITLNVGAAAPISAVAFAVSGYDALNPWETYQGVFGLPNTPGIVNFAYLQTCTVNANDLLIGACTASGSLTADTADGYTMLAQTTGGAPFTAVQTQNVSGTLFGFPNGFTLGSATNPVLITDAIRSAGSPTPAPNVPFPRDWGGAIQAPGNPATTAQFSSLAGDSVYVFILHGTANGQTLSSVADNAGNTYTRLLSAPFPSANLACYIYYCDNVGAKTGLTVTVTLSAQAIINVIAVDYTSVTSSGSLDAQGSVTNSVPGAVPTGTTFDQAADVKPNFVNDLLVGMFVGDGTTGAGAQTTFLFSNSQPSGVGPQGNAYVSATGVALGIVMRAGLQGVKEVDTVVQVTSSGGGQGINVTLLQQVALALLSSTPKKGGSAILWMTVG